MPSADNAFHAVILAAGAGARMKSTLPKVLHPLAHRPMVRHVLDSVLAAGAGDVTIVAGPDMSAVQDAVAPYPCVRQTNPLGTAHAVLAARGALQSARDRGRDVMAVFGDTPLLTPETLRAMMDARRRDPGPGVVVLGFEPEDPGAYGRLITGADGRLERVAEAADASDADLAAGLCNSGVILIDGAHALEWLERIDNVNARGEYYLTDIVAAARADGRTAAIVVGDGEEVLGVNSKRELAEAEGVMQRRLRAAAMDAGVTMTDPGTVYLAADTTFGQDVTIGPNVIFGPEVSVGDGVEIRPFCHIEGTRVGKGAVIGPFARLRPGAELRSGVHIGNFVEVKNSVVGEGSKANHLAYVGDSDVGARVNIGAGAITCNYDGYFKSRTVIGDGAFIGSNTALIAPVTVGEGAIVGAGSAITRRVGEGALAVTRSSQREVEGWADRFNSNRAAEKERARRGD